MSTDKIPNLSEGNLDGAKHLLKKLAESREFALHIGADSSFGAAVVAWLWANDVEPRAAHLPSRQPVCVQCGSPLSRAWIKHNGHGYCSIECDLKHMRENGQALDDPNALSEDCDVEEIEDDDEEEEEAASE